MVLRQVVFVVCVLVVLVGVYGWLGRRLGRDLGRRGRRLLWAALVLHVISVPVSFAAGDHLGMGLVATALAWVAFTGMGSLSILLLLLPLADLADRGVHLLRSPGPPVEGRRRFFAEAAALAVTGGLSAVGYQQARALAQVEDVEVPVEGLHPDLEGLTVVQISDLHVGPLIRREAVAAICDRVMELSPDLIAVTGDLADGSVPTLRAHTEPISRLQAPLGTWFVTGNHEYYAGAEQWVEEVARLGLTPLMNAHRLLERGQARICLGGVTDYRAADLLPAHESDPEGAFAGAPETHLRLLLAHQPQSVFMARDLGVDLQLSGHTHGGQYFPYNYLVHLFQPFVAGLHRVGGTWLYVSRGTGFWGPPNRAGSQSEITRLTLRRA